MTLRRVVSGLPQMVARGRGLGSSRCFRVTVLAPALRGSGVLVGRVLWLGAARAQRPSFRSMVTELALLASSMA